MCFDLSAFDLSTETSLASGILSPFNSALSQPSYPPHIEGEDEPELVLPSADTPNGGFGRFNVGDFSSAMKTAGNMGHVTVFEDSAINENPEFDFDMEGNILELPPVDPGDIQSVAPSEIGVGARLDNDSGISGRLRVEHEIDVHFEEVESGIPSEIS
jgi:hypothetical protein